MMDSPELVFVRSFRVADVDVHVSAEADTSAEPGILVTVGGERSGEPCQFESLLTHDQAADLALALAGTIDQARKRALD